VGFGRLHALPLPRDHFGSLTLTPRATNGIDFGVYVRRDHSGRFATILVAPFDQRKRRHRASANFLAGKQQVID
jgi:hypothetical protein